MPYLDHDGCQLHYEDYGQGAPVLLVHGLGSSTRDWEFQLAELAAHYRVIALDLRGHGRSDKPRERYSIAGFAEDRDAAGARLLIDSHGAPVDDAVWQLYAGILPRLGATRP